jgi:hypothetical protein
MVEAICIHSYNSNDPEVHSLNIGDQLVVSFKFIEIHNEYLIVSR